MSRRFTDDDVDNLLSSGFGAVQGQTGTYLDNYDAKTILQNPDFLRDLKDVMNSQGQYFDNDEDMIDEFFSERTWRDLNLAAAVGGDAGLAAVAKASPQIKEKMARIQQVYDRYPMFWEEGGRGWWEAIKDGVPAVLLAPENLIPVSSAVKAGMLARAAGTSALGAGTRTGAVSGALIETPIGAAQSALNQTTDLISGARDEFSGSQLALETAAGTVFGAGIGGALGAIGGVVGGKRAGPLLDELQKLRGARDFTLKSDPNADTSIFDTKIQEIEAQLQITAPDADMDLLEPEPTPDAVDEDGAIISQDKEQFEIADLDMLRDRFLQEAEELDDQFQIENIRLGIKPKNATDPTEVEAIKEHSRLISRAAKVEGIKKTLAEIQELQTKLDATTDTAQATKLASQIFRLRSRYNGVIKALRANDQAALDSAVDDVPVALDPTTGEATARPDLPRGDQTAPDTDASMIDENVTVDELNAAGRPNMEAPETDSSMLDETATVDELNAGDAPTPEPEPDPEVEGKPRQAVAAGDASYVARELEGAFMNDQAFENFLGNRDIQSRLIDSISQRDLNGRVVDVDQVVERLKILRNITDVTQEGPRAPFNSRMTKMLLSEFNPEDIESEEIRRLFVAQVQRDVDKAEELVAGTRNAPEPEKLIALQLRDTTKFAYDTAIQDSVSKIEGVESILGKDAMFFMPTGQRPTGLGGTSREGRVLPGDLKPHMAVKARIDQNMADNAALKGKDADNPDNYKTTVMSVTAKTGGMIRKSMSATRKDERYVPGDIITYDGGTKRASIERVGKGTQRKPDTIADPSEALLKIKDDFDFISSVNQALSSGRITIPEYDAILAKRKSSTPEDKPAAAKPGEPVDQAIPPSTEEVPPASPGEDPGPSMDDIQDVVDPEAPPADEQEEVIKEMAKGLGISREDITPVSLDEYDTMFKMAIPEGRAYAIRYKTTKPDGTESYTYRRASPAQTEAIMSGEKSIESLMGKSKNLDWEIGHVKSNKGVKFSVAQLNREFAPLGSEAPAPVKPPKPINKTSEIPIYDEAYIAENPDVRAKLDKVNKLANAPFTDNADDMVATINHLAASLEQLPEFRMPSQSRSDAIAQVNAILTKYGEDPADIAATIDVLRRVSMGVESIDPKSGGNLPMFLSDSTSPYFYNMARGYVSINPQAQKSMDNAGLTGGSQGATDPSIKHNIIAHELFHWAYANVLSNEDKVAMYRATLKYYAPDGKLDMDALQDVLDIPLTRERADLFFRPEDAGGFGININTLERSEIPAKRTGVLSAVSPSELLAQQFSLYVSRRLPYSENIFQKVARTIAEVMERMFSRKRKVSIDPDLEPYFAKLIPESSVDYLKTTGPATTVDGSVITRLMQGLHARRFDLEDKIANEEKLDGRQLREIQRGLATLIADDPDDPQLPSFVSKALQTDLSTGEQSREISDMLTPTFTQEQIANMGKDVDTIGSAQLLQANMLLNVMDEIDDRLIAAFRSKEGVNPVDPEIGFMDDPTAPMPDGLTDESKLDWEMRDLVRTRTAEFARDWQAAWTNDSNSEMAAVLENYGGEYLVFGISRKHPSFPHKGPGQRLENWITTKYLPEPTKSTKRNALPKKGKAVSEKLKSLAGAAVSNRGGQKNQADIDRYANMSDDEFRAALEDGYQDARNFLRKAEIRLGWKISQQEINANKDRYKELAKKKKQEREQAEADAIKASNENRPQNSEKPVVDTPVDTPLRGVNKQTLLDNLDRAIKDSPPPSPAPEGEPAPTPPPADDPRVTDIGGELTRRIRASVSAEPAHVSADILLMPDAELDAALNKAFADNDKERLAPLVFETWFRANGSSVKQNGPRTIGLVNTEAEAYRGVSEIDGVPNNATTSQRELLRKFTHRNKDTQRVGRTILYRLMNVGRLNEVNKDPLDLTNNFDNVRKDLRKLARELSGTGKNLQTKPSKTIKALVDFTTKASPFTADEINAIRNAHDADGYPFEADIEAFFKDRLVKAITGKGGYRPMKGDDATAANDALEARLEDVAYVANGMIGDPYIKRAAERLSYYGDMFRDVKLGPSQERKIRERSFVEGGLGADEFGNSIPFYHATPNARAFDSKDFVFRPTSDYGHYGRGIYQAFDTNVIGSVYNVRPTITALGNMIEAQVPAQDRDTAYMLAHNLQMARREQATMKLSPERQAELRAEGEWPFIDDQIMEMLEDYGLQMSPGIIETRIRAVDTLDFRETEVMAPHDVDGIEILEAAESSGLIDEFFSDQFAQRFAAMRMAPDSDVPFSGKPYNRREFYIDLVRAVQSSKNMQAQEAKSVLTDLFENMGYDSLLVTEFNRPQDQSGNLANVARYDAVVVFNPANVKSKDAKYFDPGSTLFQNTTTMEAPMNGTVADFILDPEATVDELIDGAAGVSGNGARPGLFDVLRKMTKKQVLSERDMNTLSKYNPVAFLSDNAQKLRINGMRWIGDWAKPVDGVSYHDIENSKMASKVMPLYERLNEIGDVSLFRRWTRGLKPVGKISQPESFKRIVKAMRRPTGSNLKALKPKERGMVTALRAAFAEELRLMQEAGIQIGEIKDNYFPQIWSTENIRANQKDLVDGMTAYLLRENMDKPEPMDLAKASDVANKIMSHLLNEDGLYLPKISKRIGQNDSIDFTRLIRLNEIDDTGNLKYEDILNFFEEKEFLVDDLQSIIAKYFEGTTRRIEMHNKYGSNNHGFYDYLAVRTAGANTVADLLSSDRVVTKSRLHHVEAGPGTVTETARIPEIKALSVEDARVATDVALQLIRSGKGPNTVVNYLKSLKPDSGEPYKRRAEAIGNALWEYEKLGRVENKDVKFAEQYMGTIQGRTVEETAHFNALRKFSKGMRTFNTLSLLGFTTLTSFTDVSLPFVRGASAVNAINALRNAASGPDGDEYRKALRSVGATMENLVQQRMSMMFGGTGGKLSNAFFNANGLTPWTNGMREVSVAIGYEMIKAHAKIAQKYNASGATGTRKFRRSKRILKEFGLEDYITNGKSMDDISLLYEDTRLRAALHKFAGESLFTPSRTDIPLWAQDTSEFGAIGAMLFQLKSYPLMFQRLTYRTLREAKRYVKEGDGDILPLINMLTIGGLSGSGALAAKDLVQARGGDDEASVDFRERRMTKIAESMGFNPNIHESRDEFLGWLVESYVHMGGLGLLSDLLYNVSRQSETGMYGVTRLNSLLLGPSVGAFQSLMGVMQGIQWTEADINRAGARELISRIPIAGGIRYARDEFVDIVGGERKTGGKRRSTISSSLKSALA